MSPTNDFETELVRAYALDAGGDTYEVGILANEIVSDLPQEDE